MELIPKSWASRVGRVHPGGFAPKWLQKSRHAGHREPDRRDWLEMPSTVAHRSKHHGCSSARTYLSKGHHTPRQASFNGSGKLQQVQQASTGPASFKGPSELQQAQQAPTGPAGAITGRKGPKSSKTYQTPGKPDAGIALQGQITLVLQARRALCCPTRHAVSG